MSRIVALSLAYALSGAAVPSATNASFGRYTEEQLTAWWDANVAAPRPDCGPCAARKTPAPRRVAVLLRGEAFRTSPLQHNRESCTNASIAAQARITATHVALFRWMEDLGFGVDVFGVTRPCHQGHGRGVAGAALLSDWYKPWLRAPVGLIGHAAPTPKKHAYQTNPYAMPEPNRTASVTSTVNGTGHTSPSDFCAEFLTKKKCQNYQVQMLFSRLLVDMLGPGNLESYAYLFMTRFDLAYPGTPPPCLLEGSASYNSRTAGGLADHDMLQLVSAARACSWVCAIKRTPASWDGCVAQTEANYRCSKSITKGTMLRKAPASWWRPLAPGDAGALRVPAAFPGAAQLGDAVARGAVVAAYCGDACAHPPGPVA